MSYKRSRNLDAAAISEIVGILDGWTGPLSWATLIEAIDDLMRLRYTRQTLHNHERIRLSFSLRREALKAIGVPVRTRAKSPEVETLRQINARLEAQNHRLEAENARLLEQFARWSYNANNRGVRQEVLNRPLPEVNRDSALRRTALVKVTQTIGKANMPTVREISAANVGGFRVRSASKVDDD